MINPNFVFNNINHHFFNKSFVNSSHRYIKKQDLNNNDEITNNLTEIKKFTKAKKISILQQTHSADCVIIEGNYDECNITCDAQVTNQPGIGLGILTADCLPVLLADPVNLVVGAIHAGWKGAINNIFENTITSMTKLGADISNINLLLGPCISQESYEVGPEFYQKFLEEQASNSKFFIESRRREGFFHFDLRSYSEDKIIKRGITKIHHIRDDTYAKKDLYPSYRRSVITGEVYNQSLLSFIIIDI